MKELRLKYTIYGDSCDVKVAPQIDHTCDAPGEPANRCKDPEDEYSPASPMRTPDAVPLPGVSPVPEPMDPFAGFGVGADPLDLPPRDGFPMDIVEDMQMDILTPVASIEAHDHLAAGCSFADDGFDIVGDLPIPAYAEEDNMPVVDGAPPPKPLLDEDFAPTD